MEKNLKKLFSSLLTAVLLVGAGSSAIQAEANPLKAETDINITVEEGSIIDPEEGGGGEENPGGQTGKLSIWLKPKEMNFKGKYDEVQDYTLKLDDKDGTSRRLAIADIRSKESGWKVTASLQDLESTSETVVDTIDNGNYALRLKNNKAKTYRIVNDKVESLDENDPNGVVMEASIDITGDSTLVATAPKVEGEKNGKGYTALDFEEIELEIEAGHGQVGDYKGSVIWDLSSTAN